MKYDANSIKSRKKISNRIKKIIFIFIIILLYNLTLLYVSYIDKFGASSFLYKAYNITTTSMEPEIKKDDVVIVKKVEEKNLKKGDVITFIENEETVTHRIVDIVTEDGQKEYVTKGDNNNVNDEFNTLYRDILGKVVLKIPYFGKVINVLKNGIIIILVILIVLIIYLNRIEMKEKSEIRREKKKIEDKKFLDK